MTYDPFAVVTAKARLAVLRASGLRELPADPAIERYPRLLCRTLGVPAAAVCLVDEDGVYLLGAQGLPESVPSGERLGLEHSVSKHVIAGRAPLIVSDGRKHPLVSDSTVFAELGAVAFAGLPLIIQDQPLGVVCVVDFQERAWTADELATLEDVTAALSAELELRLARQAEQARVEHADDPLEYGGDMVVSLAPDGRILSGNHAFHHVLGYPPGELEGRFAVEVVAAETREAYLAAAGRVLTEGSGEFEGALVTLSGSRRLVRGSGRCRYAEGVPLSFRLVFRDVTEERRAQEEVGLLQRVTRGVAAADDLPGALSVALAEMCRFGAWGYGEVWLEGPDGRAQQAQRWTSVPGLEALGERRAARRFAPGEGLVGDVWLSRGSRWVETLERGGASSSQEEARSMGVRAALAVPILAGDRMLGVFVFGALESRALDQHRLSVLATVAAGIGPVVQRRRAEALALETQARLTDFVHNINDLVLTFGPDGHITFANRMAQTALGYAEAELGRLRLTDLVSADSRAGVLQAIERVMAGESISSLEARFIARDGRAIDVEGSANARIEGGRPIAMRSYFRDVTARRRAEEESRRTAQMLELAQDGIVIHRLPDGVITYWNNGAEQLYGWTAQEAVGREVGSLLANTSHVSDEEMRNAVLRHGRWEGELRHARRDGRIVTVESHWTLMREQGEPVAILEINTDITERKRAQELFGAVLAAATENAIIAGDTLGIITAFNAGAERMLGYTAREVVGRCTPEIFHDPAEVAARAAELGVEPGGQVFINGVSPEHGDTHEWTYVRKDGTRLPVSVTLTAMPDHDGAIRGYIGVATDISERKRVEQELRAARDAAENATQAKSEFLANMSHEIRTPMNAIVGMTEVLLLDEQLTDAQRHQLRLVHVSAESLLLIINDILDLSRVEAGRFLLDPQPFNLRDGLTETLRILGTRAQEKNIELSFHVHADVPDALVGDLGRLRQVLVNLVGNAIKFTDRGEVAVQVSAEPETQGKILLHMDVRDTGVGIAPHLLEKIFEPFTQAGATHRRRASGTGLGLTICRRMLGLMGGSISVESQVGAGSTFRVALPLLLDRMPRARPLEPGSGGPAAPARQLRILLAEDNLINQEVACAMLERDGHTVCLASDGREAVAQAQASDFDIMLMDVEMPELSGLEAAALIREQERASGRHLPIIAVTAHALKGDRERCLAAGMDGYLTKPLRAADLLGEVARVLAAREAPPPLASAPGA